MLITGVVLGVLVSARPSDAQAEKSELGFRWQLVPPGGGSTIVVTAPPEFCTDASRELQVTWFPTPGRSMSISRLLAGPSPCTWNILDVPREGMYRAVIRVGRLGDILADGQGQMGSNGIIRLVLEPPQVELTGRITLDGVPFADVPTVADLRIRFERDSHHWPYWDAPIGSDGQYVVKVSHLTPGEKVCARIGTQRSMNHVHSGLCENVQPGLRALDVDFYLPQPGLIRIDIPPDKTASPTTVFELVITPAAPEGSDRRRPLRRLYGSTEGFRALDGLTTEFLAQRFGEYDVRLVEPDFTNVSPTEGAPRPVRTSTRVTLSAEQPIVSLTLGAPRP
jgi:hypothetical protein